MSLSHDLTASVALLHCHSQILFSGLMW